MSEESEPENLNPVAPDPAEDLSLLDKVKDTLGLGGGDDEAPDSPNEPPDEPPVVTDEFREQTAAEAEVDRKAAIKKNMSGNQGKKDKRIAGVRAAR